MCYGSSWSNPGRMFPESAQAMLPQSWEARYISLEVCLGGGGGSSLYAIGLTTALPHFRLLAMQGLMQGILQGLTMSCG